MKPGSELLEAEWISATAWLLGERIDTRGVPAEHVVVNSPMTLADAPDRMLVLYRFGAVVVFVAGEESEPEFPEIARGLVQQPFASPESDFASIRVDRTRSEGPDHQGVLVIAEATLDRLHVVADVLARSAVLAYYEAEATAALDRLQPIAERMRTRGSRVFRARHLLTELGEALVSEMRMVGRAEVSEKPGRIWDRPDLDALYVRLAEEYELAERDHAVTRKLELLGRTANTFLDVLGTRRSLLVEWYIVILILLEIVILVYDLSTR